MCGIAGIWRRSAPLRGDCERLVRMGAILEHRGPDDFGYLYASTVEDKTEVTRREEAAFQPDVLLASRRLSITDHSAAGQQPFANDSGDIFVIFNGAIHNFEELRRELQDLGHRFRSNTDTEVLLRSYEQWGEECASRFNGMWAYVIWDHRRGKMVFSRDRFGIKPLYISASGDNVLFASEAKGILATGDIDPEPELGYLRHILASRVQQEGVNSPFKGIRQVPAGHNLVVTQNKLEERRYWDYGDQSESYDYDRPGETFRTLLSDSLRLRLRSDVPTALLLSGGMDSSALAVSISEHENSAEIPAFTARFSGFHQDESGYAEIAAKRAGMPLTMVDFDAGNMLEVMSAVSWHMDSPAVRGQMLARWSLIEAAAREAKVLLEGQGADEILGGYPHRYYGPYIDSEMANLGWSDFPGVFLRVMQAATAREYRHKLKIRRGSKRQYDKKSSGILSRRFDEVPPWDPGFGAIVEPPGLQPLERQMWEDHARTLLPYLLHFGDALSMGHSMEARLPFMDHRLVEFLFALPYRYKIRGRKTKYLLHEVMRNRLPMEILGRKRKVGFRAPHGQWVKHAFNDQLRPLIESTSLKQRDIFDSRKLSQRVKAYEATGESPMLMMRIAAIELWYRQFIDQLSAHP